jgi:uncharacterized membrane protein YraQ (UPF0718 family)
MEFYLNILSSGWQALVEYLLQHTVTCLIPAFFIAGAISTFVSQESVLKYFGPNANKFLAYGVASVSGTILAVCSCTVLPLFAGIFKAGAGIGPAITFLYSGPAINILAIVYSARLLGFDLGLARAIGAILFSVVIGLLMAFIYRKEEAVKKQNAATPVFAANGKTTDWHRLGMLTLLVSVLLTATARIAGSVKWPLVAFEILGVIIASNFWFEREEIMTWLEETWKLAYQVVPMLLVGVFLAGIIKALLPPTLVASFVGENTILANLGASVVGALMYFATLTEVPIIKAFLELGMDKGPALALMLSGPALSLPSMLALGRIMGARKTITYVFLVVIFSTLAGFFYGKLI